MRSVLGATLVVVISFFAPVGASVSASSAGSPLRTLIEQAWREHPAALAAENALQAAEARARAAAAPTYNPELEIGQEQADVDTTELGLTYTLDWGGKRRARRAVADQELEAARALYDEARQSVAVELIRAVSAYVATADARDLSRRRAEAMDRFAQVSERRHGAGDLSKLDRELAVLARQEARIQAAEAEGDFAAAQQALYALIGREPRALTALVEDVPRAPTLERVESLLADLPLLRRIAAEREAAQAGVDLARREARPDPTVTLRGGRVDTGVGTENLAGVSLSVPLFVRNSYRAERDAATAEAGRATESYRDAYRRAESELRRSHAAYAALVDAWDGWVRHGAHSADRAELLSRLWEAGELDATDYLVQVQQTLDAEIAGARLRGRVWEAWTAWLVASGTLNAWLGLDAAPSSTN